MVVCKKAYHKIYCAKNREQILARQKRYRAENAEILKSRRKRWYENNRERLASSQRAYCQQNKEHIRDYQRQYCKNNRERINEYWRSYYAKNKEQIRKRLRDQKRRKVGQNIVRIGAWNQESEKLETSLVPSDTLYETPTVKSVEITSLFGFHAVVIQSTS